MCKIALGVNFLSKITYIIQSKNVLIYIFFTHIEKRKVNMNNLRE